MFDFINKHILKLVITCLIVLTAVQIIINNTIISIVGYVIFTMLIFVYKKANDDYVIQLCKDLSDMIDNIINNPEVVTFPLNEDSLVSKLQFQTNKITNILISKNLKIEEDKKEVQMLISDIAHQLKTPMANISIYSELLEDETLTVIEREDLKKIMLANISRLSFLLDSLIKMSRIESGVIQINKRKNNLNDNVLQVVKDVTTLCVEKNLDIVYNPINNVDCELDSKWFKEAVINILENAIKYSYNNTNIEITIQKLEMFTKVDISNVGIGIQEEDFNKVFKRFYRGENALDKDGIGIGLYISNRILELHGGYISLKCKGEKVVFSLFLPN